MALISFFSPFLAPAPARTFFRHPPPATRHSPLAIPPGRTNVRSQKRTR
jgi:hypothetical protein